MLKRYFKFKSSGNFRNIVIDDGSTDTTSILNKFKGMDIIILNHKKNFGKETLKTGIAEAPMR